MFRLTSLVTALLLLASMDFPRISLLPQQSAAQLNAAFASASTPPDIFVTAGQCSKAKAGTPEARARLEIIRYVDQEYARVVQPLPSQKQGFHYVVGKPVDPGRLRSALARGSAANPGDQVQITNIEFREKQIIVSINGGTKKHFNLRQHVQVSMGGVPMTTSSPTAGAPSQKGADLVLDFGGRVPDLTPDQLKADLSPFLSFGSAQSAAVNWVETLPPEFQKAIKDHTAIVGMNHDMVLAAVGRPDQKVREYDDNGRENEDWIYGHPPEKTTLVTFLGDKVIRVKSY